MAPTTVTFISRYSRHKLVRQPKMQAPLATGGYHTVARGVSYQFQATPDGKGGTVGTLTVRKGQDKLVDHIGWLARGEDEDVERDAVEALKAHRAFGQSFWIEGFPPGVRLPRPQEWRRDVIAAAAALDEERLVEMVGEERRSHARAELVREAELALAAVREQAAQIEAAKAKQAPKPAAKQKATA